MEPTTLLIFSIPLVAILSKFGMQWLKLRAEQRALGVSSRDLEQKVERLEKANAEYAHRLENLEAIVVSQTWNVLQEPGLPEADRQRRIVAASRHEIAAPDLEEMNRQRAAHLAGRLRG